MGHGIAAKSRSIRAEFLSALARRLRDGDIATGGHRDVVSSLVRDFDKLFAVELTARLVKEARHLLDRGVLRADDALQLASCAVLRSMAGVAVTFVAFDQRRNEPAAWEGQRSDGD